MRRSLWRGISTEWGKDLNDSIDKHGIRKYPIRFTPYASMSTKPSETVTMTRIFCDKNWAMWWNITRTFVEIVPRKVGAGRIQTRN